MLATTKALSCSFPRLSADVVDFGEGRSGKCGAAAVGAIARGTESGRRDLLTSTLTPFYLNHHGHVYDFHGPRYTQMTSVSTGAAGPSSVDPTAVDMAPDATRQAVAGPAPPSSSAAAEHKILGRSFTVRGVLAGLAIGLVICFSNSIHRPASPVGETPCSYCSS